MKPILLIIAVLVSTRTMADCNPWVNGLVESDIFDLKNQVDQMKGEPWIIKGEEIQEEARKGAYISASADIFSAPVLTSDRVCTSVFISYTKYSNINPYGFTPGVWTPNKDLFEKSISSIIDRGSLSQSCSDIDFSKYFYTQNISNSKMVEIWERKSDILKAAVAYENIKSTKNLLSLNHKNIFIYSIYTGRSDYSWRKLKAVNYFISLKDNTYKCHSPVTIEFDFDDSNITIKNVTKSIY